MIWNLCFGYMKNLTFYSSSEIDALCAWLIIKFEESHGKYIFCCFPLTVSILMIVVRNYW